MRISQVEAGGQFIEVANQLLLLLPHSALYDQFSGKNDYEPPEPYIPPEHRREIEAITVAAGQLRARQSDRLLKTDLDELFEPFLDQLEPFKALYCS